RGELAELCQAAPKNIRNASRTVDIYPCRNRWAGIGVNHTVIPSLNCECVGVTRSRQATQNLIETYGCDKRRLRYLAVGVIRQAPRHGAAPILPIIVVTLYRTQIPEPTQLLHVSNVAAGNIDRAVVRVIAAVCAAAPGHPLRGRGRE